VIDGIGGEDGEGKSTDLVRDGAEGGRMKGGVKSS